MLIKGFNRREELVRLDNILFIMDCACVFTW
jgi:hypothetical protein